MLRQNDRHITSPTPSKIVKSMLLIQYNNHLIYKNFITKIIYCQPKRQKHQKKAETSTKTTYKK